MVQETAADVPQTEPETGQHHSVPPFVERRAVGRALSCWDYLRKSKEFPNRADCLEIFDEDLTNGMIVIEFTPQEEDDMIVECGPLFRNAYGGDPVGLAAKNVLPSSTDRGLIFWRVAAQMRKPIADVGEFTNLKGQDVLYRSVFLPISEDGERITHLMAAFSYKAIQ
jgi:hypothetical protein